MALKTLIAAGIVLTGGSAKIEGAGGSGRGNFSHAGKRLGVPQYVYRGWWMWYVILIFATGVGLLLFGHHRMPGSGGSHSGYRFG